jgi:hypothetical protein
MYERKICCCDAETGKYNNYTAQFKIWILSFSEERDSNKYFKTIIVKLHYYMTNFVLQGENHAIVPSCFTVKKEKLCKIRA